MSPNAPHSQINAMDLNKEKKFMALSSSSSSSSSLSKQTWTDQSKQGSVVVGTSDHPEQVDALKAPVSLSLDKHANLYVVDYYDHRVQRFAIDPTSIV